MENMKGRFSELENKVNIMAAQFKRFFKLMKEKGPQGSAQNELETPPGFTPPNKKRDGEGSSRDVIGTGSSQKRKEDEQKIEILEKRLQAIEGSNLLGSFNVDDFCLVPDVKIPADFKVPEFVKYDGKTCPVTHLTLFFRKIQPLTQDEGIRIALFQDSLVKSSLQWYLSLGSRTIKTWNDLTQAFVNNYRHITDLASDRQSLQNLEKRNRETFKEYAHRWRNLAAEVQPLKTEKEMVTMFVQTLKPPFYDKLIKNSTNYFSDVVLSGERIEYGIRTGKIVEYPNNDGKHMGIQNVSTDESHSTPWNACGRTSPGVQATFTRRKEMFDPILVSYTKLYSKLLEGHLIEPIQAKEIQPPYPKWYEKKAVCEYHTGVSGHSLENYYALKTKVQQLLESKILCFSDEL